ncbi:zinc finger, CCHC-type containing protein [Tanacetum coccineum]
MLKKMVNSMLSYYGLSQGFWGEAICKIPDPRLKTLGERGIECIFFGYVKHSKAFRFNVIEPNEFVSIIESMDAIFDENRFSSLSRPSLRIHNRTEYIGVSKVSDEVPLGVTKEVVDNEQEMRSLTNTPIAFNVEDDPKTFNEAMQSHDVDFWKEAINDEMDYIMGNDTWVLTDLPSVYKPLVCKWIFKRKMKVDGIIEKFKARLVLQGFRQKSRIDYFDTYASIDVKIAFLNGELDEKVYMNQPHDFIMPRNKNKVCKLINSLYGLKQAPKKWHQKFDEVVLSSGYLLNQAGKCVYSKFDESDKGVVICLYIDDMQIFGTDQVQVNITKEFLSSRFSMKDMGEDDVIMALETAGKEAEWLRHLILEIPLWPKPIAHIFICYDSATTLIKAYSQMYNGKSRHLGVRHSMIRELIMNEVLSIEFIRSQQNLADNLTKGLAKDLVIKSAKRMV